jgi:hypothetical protein
MKCDIRLLLLVLLGFFLYSNSMNNKLLHNTNIIIHQKKDISKLQEPSRHSSSQRQLQDNKINTPTRGEPPEYQQLGILTDISNPENIKPLYGRQTYYGSNKWNYYSSLDSHLSTKIPITIDHKKCTDEYGCQEINENDIIQIGKSTTNYSVTLYSMNTYRYIPHL